MVRKLILGLIPLLALSCSGKKNVTETADENVPASVGVTFDADSAYSYIARQVEFGPRVSNTPAHRKTAEWLAGELRRHGACVSVQEGSVTDADGSDLPIRNIFGQFNPDSSYRLLLLAHWDTRPWADEDPDEKNHDRALDGANDGASGVGVLLEIARLLGKENPAMGVDILFVDAEDRGVHNNDESWALGSRYFAANPVYEGYFPREAILLDMVGARGACFAKEQISVVNSSSLVERMWKAASDAGFGNYFPNIQGGAVTDDHVELLKAGIPAIDIIDFRPEGDTGFAPGWHTMGDNMSVIDKESLRAVGQSLLQFIYGKY